MNLIGNRARRAARLYALGVVSPSPDRVLDRLRRAVLRDAFLGAILDAVPRLRPVVLHLHDRAIDP